MELLQLKYFCDAAASENFSQTARKFFVPPSNISQSIGRLERELGCPLFEHRGNKVRLNEDGRRFYECASSALSLLAQGAAALAEREGTIGGEIHIACHCSRSTATRAMERFMRLYPEVKLLLCHELPTAVDFDILISDRCPFAYEERRLLLDEPICLAVSQKHPLAGRGSASLSEVADERFISMSAGRSLYDITQEACAAAGFVPNIAIRLDDPFYIRKYVELGLGVALVPAVSWAGLFPQGVALLSLPGLRRKIYAYLPSGRPRKRATERFLAVLAEVCGE